MSALSGAWTKLRRANVHANDLKGDLLRFFDEDTEPPVAYRRELDLDTGDGRYLVKRVKSFPVDWSLQIGDFLNNTRGALDHLAWALVKDGLDPNPEQEHRVQFPIYDLEDEFDRQLGNRLPGVVERYVTVIRTHQPYTMGESAKDHPLALLRDYGRIDKHREIHPVLGRQSGPLSVQVFGVKNYTVTRTEPGADVFVEPLILGVGAELVRFYGTVDGPDPEVKMESAGSFAPAFPDGRPIFPVLEFILMEVRGLLTEFDPVF